MDNPQLALPQQVKKINKQLALVLPLDVGDRVHYVYSQPLPPEVFKRYWLIFSKTFATIYNENLTMMAGPRIAAMAMREFATTHGLQDEVELGVFGELKRLSYVIHPVEGKGWQQLMLDDALKANLLSAEDMDEVENILTFFTVTWSMHRGGTREAMIGGAARLWDAQTTLSTCSEFVASLPKLTTAVNSGVTVKVA
jgi:hypothetical protein